VSAQLSNITYLITILGVMSTVFLAAIFICLAYIYSELKGKK
jgi:hypothetical protein